VQGKGLCRGKGGRPFNKRQIEGVRFVRAGRLFFCECSNAIPVQFDNQISSGVF